MQAFSSGARQAGSREVRDGFTELRLNGRVELEVEAYCWADDWCLEHQASESDCGCDFVGGACMKTSGPGWRVVPYNMLWLANHWGT